MARLYANENFPQPVVARLRELGHDVLTVVETGLAGKALSDMEVLRFAIDDARAILTLNRRHFVRLHNAEPNHSGTIACAFDADFISQAERKNKAIADHGDLTGALVRIHRPQK
jgi:hypothetical protein